MTHEDANLACATMFEDANCKGVIIDVVAKRAEPYLYI